MTRGLLAAFLFLFAGLCNASEPVSPALDATQSTSQVTRTQAMECVEPTEVMRRDHMDFLDHQRDATVIDGIRTKKHSLVECINCHVQPDKNGEVARIDSPEHFCAGCHMFAGVKIDCFECHADRPENLAYQHDLSIENQHHKLTLNLGSSQNLITPDILKTLVEQAESDYE